MTDVAGSAKIRSEKSAAIKSDKPAAIVPMFGLPKFEMPNFGVPIAYPEFAKHGLTQAKENCAKAKIAADAASAAIADSFAVIVRGSSDCNLKVIEAARANISAMFDYVMELLGDKVASDVIDVTTKRAHKQFETFVSQTTELTALTQRVAIDAAEPVKVGLTKAFNNAA